MSSNKSKRLFQVLHAPFYFSVAAATTTAFHIMNDDDTVGKQTYDD